MPTIIRRIRVVRIIRRPAVIHGDVIHQRRGPDPARSAFWGKVFNVIAAMLIVVPLFYYVIFIQGG